MFVDLPKAPTFDSSSWTDSLGNRIQNLLDKPRRVAWLYENLDTSTFRYRAINMLEALQQDSKAGVSASWFAGDELTAIEEVIRKLSTLVITRFRYSPALHRIVNIARQHGVRILFDSDDLVFDVTYAPLIADTLAQDFNAGSTWDYWFAYMGRLDATAQLCDGGITTNPYLAAKMQAKLPGKSIKVVPNFLNRQQQEYSAELMKSKQANGWRRNESITIGYFSGSPTHRKDFAVAAPAIVRILECYPDVNVRVVGYLDETGPLKRFADRVEILPHMDFISLQRAIAEVEINIAPLQENAFTNCKSELKFFEAAAVGTWTVASPTSTFRSAIQDGKTGRLACAHEWDDALNDAIHLVRNIDTYRQRAETSAQHVYATYGWDRLTPKILDATMHH